MKNKHAIEKYKINILMSKYIIFQKVYKYLKKKKI